MKPEDSFGSVPIEIVCPECGETMRRTVGWLMDHSDVTCSNGHTTHLHVEAFRDEIARSEREWAGLREALTKRVNGGRSQE